MDVALTIRPDFLQPPVNSRSHTLYTQPIVKTIDIGANEPRSRQSSDLTAFPLRYTENGHKIIVDYRQQCRYCCTCHPFLSPSQEGHVAEALLLSQEFNERSLVNCKQTSIASTKSIFGTLLEVPGIHKKRLRHQRCIKSSSPSPLRYFSSRTTTQYSQQ